MTVTHPIIAPLLYIYIRFIWLEHLTLEGDSLRRLVCLFLMLVGLVRAYCILIWHKLAKSCPSLCPETSLELPIRSICVVIGVIVSEELSKLKICLLVPSTRI